MLDDPRPRCLAIRIIHRRISLKIRFVQHFRLKAYRTILQSTQLVFKVSINRPCINNLIRQSIQLCLILEIIRIQTHFNSIQHIGNHLRIAAHRNSLIQSIKIIVIKRQSNRQSLNNKSRKILAIASPLLLRITLDQLLVNILANQRDRLFLQIVRLRNAGFVALLLNFRCCLLRCHNAPHLIERIHVKRQRIQLSLIIRYRTVRKTIELGKTCNIIPHFFIICMENVRTVFVHMDILNILRINVACNVRALVDHKHFLTGIRCLSGKYRTE